MRPTLLALLLVPAFACSPAWREEKKIAALFREAGVTGTFVLLDTTDGTLSGYNQARAATRFSPASTFKIANSLIGLTVGAVSNVDEVFPYNGEKRRFPEWERAMGLREGMRVSNVPVYQELARRIGPARMQEYLERLAYGNRDHGENPDSFWLEGPLAISAVEQVRFLENLAAGRLPVPEAVQASVREILLLEETAASALHAKTGWSSAHQPDIGWWVGWVRKQGRVYCFALNIDIPDPALLPQRVALGKAALRALGILE